MLSVSSMEIVPVIVADTDSTSMLGVADTLSATVHDAFVGAEFDSVSVMESLWSTTSREALPVSVGNGLEVAVGMLPLVDFGWLCDIEVVKLVDDV